MSWTDEQLATDRLRLRPACDADEPAIVEMLQNADVRRYLGGPVPPEHIAGVMNSVVGERWGSFIVTAADNGSFVGNVSFDREHGELEVSYQLLPEFWGNGLAREAVAAAIAWVWAKSDDPSLIAVTQSANVRSLQLLNRLGFTPECQFEEFGATQDQLRLMRPASDLT